MIEVIPKKKHFKNLQETQISVEGLLPLLALVEYVGIALHVIALLLPALNSHPKHACPRKVPLMASTE